MHQDANAAFTAAHDGGDIGDAEVGDHTEEYGLGLVGGQGSYEPDRAIECCGSLVVIDGWVGRRMGHRGSDVLVAAATTSIAANLVDTATGRDREQPAPEVVGSARE